MKNKTDGQTLRGHLTKAFPCDLQYTFVRQKRNVNLRSFIYLTDSGNYINSSRIRARFSTMWTMPNNNCTQHTEFQTVVIYSQQVIMS